MGALPRVLGGPATWEPSERVTWADGEPSWPRSDTPQAIQWPLTTAASAVADVVASGTWVSGQVTADVEATLTSLCEAPYAITVSNGTWALVAAYAALMRARKATPGAEVIIPAATFAATASAAELVGLVPVVVDVDPETLTITSEAIKRAITPRTLAAVAVPLYDACPDVGAIAKVCGAAGVALVIDAAHAPLATWQGETMSTWADVVTHSYQTSKVLSAGEGGCVVTHDSELASYVTQFRNCGRTPEQPPAWWHADPARTGYNLRWTEMGAAILRDGLAAYPGQAKHRERQYAKFVQLVERDSLPFTCTPRDKRATDVMYKVGLRHTTGCPTPVLRDALSRQLTTEVAAPYAPLGDPASLWAPASGADIGPFPAAQAAHDTWMMLPHEYWLRPYAATDLHAALTILAEHADALASAGVVA